MVLNVAVGQNMVISNPKINCINIVIQLYSKHLPTNLETTLFYSLFLILRVLLLSFPGMLRPSVLQSLCSLDKTRQDSSDTTSAIMTYSLLFVFHYYRVFSVTNYLHAWCMCLFFLFFLPFPLFYFLYPAGHQQEGPSPPQTRAEPCSFISDKREAFLATVACKECRNVFWFCQVRQVRSGKIQHKSRTNPNVLFSSFSIRTWH